MKKYLSVGLILLLCFTLSIPSFAVGNSYSFTSSWFKVLFDNAVVLNNTNEPTFTTSSCVISQNGEVYNADRDYNNCGIYLKTDSAVKPGTLSVTIPLNLTIHSSFEYLDLEFFTSFYSSVKFIDATLRVGNRNFSTTSTVTPLDSCAFGHLVFSSPSANFGTFESDFSGTGEKINIRYNKIISSSEQVIDSITLNFTCTGSTFALGVPCVDSLVNLPDSFYDAIYTIKYLTRLMNANIDTLNAHIVSIQSQLDEIIGKVGSSTEEQNNYYNTIVNQSPEQAAVVAQLQSDLAAAKEELAQIQEVITSVPAPSAENIFNTDTSTSSDDYISDALSDNTVLDLFTYFFDNSFVIMALGVSITIATVSYILYGKKG